MTQHPSTFRAGAPSPEHASLADLSLPSLRRLLVDQRARMRVLQEQVRVARARAEQACIDAHGGDPKALGSTQQDRERVLLLFLDGHAYYQELNEALADHEHRAEALQAEIEAARDVRRELEGERLERYIHVLTNLAGTPIVCAATLQPGVPA